MQQCEMLKFSVGDCVCVSSRQNVALDTHHEKGCWCSVYILCIAAALGAVIETVPVPVQADVQMKTAASSSLWMQTTGHFNALRIKNEKTLLVQLSPIKNKIKNKNGKLCTGL